MGKYVLKNGKILLNGYDLSGDHNSVELSVTREEKDVTTFGSVGMKRLAGMQSFNVSGGGFFEAGTGKTDTVVWSAFSTTANEVTIMPQGSTAGSVAFISQMDTFEYAPGGSVGDAMGFTFAGAGEGVALVEGKVLKSGAVSSSGTGTAFSVGQIASGRRGYATLHVTATSGSGDRTLDVTIQSDASSSFSSPTTHITFTQVTTAVASEWKYTTAASTTDSWWRAKWIPVGTGESFTMYVTFGVSYL